MTSPPNTKQLVLLSSLALLIAAGCETAIDPQSGERTTRVTAPGTAAHGERLEERWRQCIRFGSEDRCARNLGWRPSIDRRKAIKAGG